MSSTQNTDNPEKKEPGTEIHEHDWCIVDFDGGEVELCETCLRPRYDYGTTSNGVIYFPFYN